MIRWWIDLGRTCERVVAKTLCFFSPHSLLFGKAAEVTGHTALTCHTLSWLIWAGGNDDGEIRFFD